MSVPAPIPTGVVSMLEGVVRVIRAGGKSAGALKVGDALQAGDVIFASAGTSFQLTGADGQLWTPPAGGLPADQATGVGDVAALADMRKALLAQGRASLDEAVARLNQATEEDAPAAGLSGGATGALAEGLRVGRVQESVGTQEYAYDAPTLDTASEPLGGSVINGDAIGDGTLVVDPASPNLAPITGDDNVTTDEDTAVSGQVVGSDADGDALIYALGTGPSNGTVSVNANGAWTYTPAANFNGADSFTVSVSDGNGGVTTATVNVGVTPVNDAPVASADSTTTVEDTPVTIDVLGNDTDVDGPTLSIKSATVDPAQGSVSIVDDKLVFTPAPNFAGSATITYVSTDGSADSAPTAVTVTVTPVNDAPVAANQAKTTAEDTQVTGKVVASDVDGDALSYAVQSGAAHGTLTLNATTGDYTYTPAANYNGTDSFTVRVSDGKGGFVDSVVSVTITPVNNAPTANNDSLTAIEDTAVTYTAAQVLGNDTDIDSTNLSIASVTAGSGGSVVLNADGTVTFTPNANFNGTADFTYTVTDGALTSVPATVTVAVSPVNDAPVAVADSATTAEDTPVIIDVLANDTDVDGPALSIKSATVDPAQGSVSIVDGKLVFTPAPNFAGSATITYVSTDGSADSAPTAVNVTVTPVNDAPITANHSTSTTEDTPVTGKVVASDVDGDVLSYSVQSGASHGTLALNATTGDYTYTPAANYNGADSFTVSVSDGQGGVAIATVNVSVTPANDAPVINPTSPGFDPIAGNYSVTTEEDVAVSGQVVGTDADGDALSYALGSSPVNGTVTVNPNGSWTYTPAANFNGSDSFTVSVSDGNGGVTTATVNVGVTPVNDAPAAANQTKTTAEDTPVTGKVVASDVDGDALSYAVQSGAAHGTLALNTTTGDYTYTPDANYNGTDSFTVRVSDGKGGFVDSVVSVTVSPVNNTPTANNDSLTAVEDTAVTYTAAQLVGNDTDIDSTNLTIASVTAVSGGSVVLNADGTVTFTPNGNFNGTADFTYTVTDSVLTSEPATVTVAVSPVNDTPVAVADSATTAEDTPVIIDVLSNDTDIDGPALSIKWATVDPDQGSVSIVDGKLVFTPAPNFSGSATITYVSTDGSSESAPTAVTVTVTPVNDAPVAANQTKTTEEDTPVTGKVVASDVDGDTLSYTVQSGAAHGTLSLNATTGDYTYTPAANYNGADSFTVSVSDGQGGVAIATVNVSVTPANDAPVINPTSTGFDPVAGNYSVTTDEDTAVSGQVVGSDADGDALTYALGTGPSNGTVSVNANGSWTYTPTANFNGADNFTVSVSDGKGGTTTATVNVGVTPINDAPVIDPSSPGFDPVAGNYSVTTEEDTPVSGQVVGSDADGDALTYALGTGPSNGTVSVNANGAWTYTPAGDFNGSDSFTVSVSDGNGGVTTATVNVGVTPANDVPVIDPSSPGFDPVAGNYSVTTEEDTPVSGQVVGSDADGDALTYALGSGPANGTVSLNANGSWTYTPATNFNGTDNFTVSVSDGNGGVTTATVNVGVTPANDAPVIDPSSPGFDPVAGNYSVTTEEDTPVSGQVVGSDADGDALTYALGTGPSNGTVSVKANGAWTYTPAGDFNGADSFTVSVSDGKGGTTTATVNVGVTPANDVPVIDPSSPGFDPVAGNYSVTTEEDTPVSGQVVGSDADGDALIYALGTGPSNGTVSVNANGSWTYTPSANFNGSDSFTVSVSDGNGGVTTSNVNVGVTPTNDVPVIDPTSPGFDPVAGNYSVTTEEDTAVSGQVIGSDADGDALTYALGTGPVNGTVSVNANGAWTYTPAANFNGSDSFTVSVSDGNGGVTTATVNVGVTPVNDAPVASADSATTAEDTPVTVDVLGNDTDVDGPTLSIKSATVDPAQGSVSIVDGKLVFTPAPNFAGSATITYVSTDGSADSAPTAVTVTVTPVNDAPVANNDGLSAIEDTAVTYTAAQLVGNDTDIDSTNLSIASVTAGSGGSVVLNADGTVTFTPNANFNGTADFTYTVTDGALTSVPATVTVAVSPVNDAPVAVADSATTAEDTPVIIDVLANDTDVDGPALSIKSATVDPAQGSVSIVDGKLVFTPAPNFAGSATITYVSTDGSADSAPTAVNVTVTPVNDAPITANHSTSTTEDTPVTGKVIASDVDGDALSYTVQSGAAHGTLALNATTGDYTYTPLANYNGTDSFTVRVRDGKGGFVDSVVSVSVAPVNNAPTANNDSLTAIEDTAVTYTAAQLLGNDTDVDSTNLTIASVTAGSGGYVVLNADGTVTFTPNANFNGTADFTYTVTDGEITSAPATVSVAVSPVNDAPVASADSATTAEDTPVTIDVLSNDTDVDGPALSIKSATVDPTQGSV
ncbi:tandem-95 repeat protein, partial [Aquabacterium sp.]|uniref:tandem-95 repeat protein n=1 Tax=Aquabacterium sp. TaxID=1872578 RepID=UPI003CFC0F0E